MKEIWSRSYCTWAIKFIAVVLLLLIAVCPALADQVGNIDYLHFKSVPEKSSLEINGTSTLHDWSAGTNEVHGSIELIDDTEIGACPADKAFPLVAAEDVDLVFRVPIKGLKSDSQGLDEEMRKGLDYDKHPNITFQFDSAFQLTAPGSHDCAFRVKGFLQVNGVYRPMDFIVKVKHPCAELLEIETEVTLKMTDFKITPPSFMGGLLTSGDEVKIKLSWALAPS